MNSLSTTKNQVILDQSWNMFRLHVISKITELGLGGSSQLFQRTAISCNILL